MKKKVIIVGARPDGHAKVVLKILLLDKRFEVIGFIDDDSSKTGCIISGLPVLGKMGDIPGLKAESGINAGIVAIGHNAQRRALSEQLKAAGLELINAIHPSVIIDEDVEIGAGNYLGQGVIIVTGSKIGDCVNIHTGATIDHDNNVSDGANIGPGVHTSGRVIIGQNAFIGVGSSIIPDIKIGEGAVIGGGSVVIRDIPPFDKVAGNPTRKIGITG